MDLMLLTQIFLAANNAATEAALNILGKKKSEVKQSELDLAISYSEKAVVIRGLCQERTRIEC